MTSRQIARLWEATVILWEATVILQEAYREIEEKAKQAKEPEVREFWEHWQARLDPVMDEMSAELCKVPGVSESRLVLGLPIPGSKLAIA